MCSQLMFGTRGMQLRATLPFYFSKHFLRHPAGLADLGSPDLEDLKGATCFWSACSSWQGPGLKPALCSWAIIAPQRASPCCKLAVLRRRARWITDRHSPGRLR